jgi:uncharacterized membrane protein YgdD (TMEM256/DUF423 family)
MPDDVRRGEVRIIMATIWFKLAAAFMMLGVACGAFGAHGLRGHLSQAYLEIYKTAVLYQFIHAIGLFVVAFAEGAAGPSRMLTWAGISFTVGILVFSGSLYLLTLTDTRWLGAITPLGGLAFILGWAALFFSHK